MIVSAGYFATCAVALLVATWWIRRQDADATITALFDRIMTSRAARVAIIVMWWWIGWHFLAGQTVDHPPPVQ
jgi:hypothetical protein